MKILLSIEGAGEPLRGVRLSGSEGVSAPYRSEIDVVFGVPTQGMPGDSLDKLGIGSHGALAAHAGAES